MSLSRETLLELMALADDELEGEGKRRIEELVDAVPEAQRVVDGFRDSALRHGLVEVLDRQAAAAGADRIADSVMARLGAAEGGPPGAATSRRPGARTPVSRRWALGGTGASLALAAAAWLYVHAISAPLEMVGRVARVEAPAPVASTTTPSAEGTEGVEVEEIDSPARGVSVFEVALGGTAAAMGVEPRPPSVVIWIDDEPGAQ